MAKIRNISILVYEVFEKQRIALGQTSDQYLAGLLGIKDPIPIKEEDVSNIDPEAVIDIPEKKKGK